MARPISPRCWSGTCKSELLADGLKKEKMNGKRSKGFKKRALPFFFGGIDFDKQGFCAIINQIDSRYYPSEMFGF